MRIIEIIKLIYIYLFSAIGLILVIIGTVKLIDLGLKVYVFKQADFFYSPKIYPEIVQGEKLTPEEIAKREEEQRKADEINRIAERQRTASNAIALIIVGLPVFIYHWQLALKYHFNKE
jgi:hypothetical protein